MHNEIVEFLNKEVAGCEALTTEVEAGDQSVEVKPEFIKQACFALKDSAEFQFNVLQVVSGVDYEDRIEVCYMLASFKKNLDLILKVKLPRPTGNDTVKIDSVCDIWKSANFLERETYDMLGVEFVGHPDHRRILCPEDWEGFPLRKDYVVQETYQGMDVNPAHKINQDDFDFMTKLKLEAEEPKKVSGSWDGNVSPELADALTRKLDSIKKAKEETKSE